MSRDRVQKLRASRSKDEAEQVRCQLTERDSVIAEQRAELDSVKAKCHRLTREKNDVDAETSALQVSVHPIISCLCIEMY